MANLVCEVLLTDKQLQPPRVDVDLACGAVVDFQGIVRPLENGREIEGIDYETHTMMADHQLAKIAERAASDFALNLVVIHHRIGFVPVGESSLSLRVASQHRAKAFEASEWIVDELKKRVPIWKRPRFKIDNRSKGDIAVEKASIPLRT